MADDAIRNCSTCGNCDLDLDLEKEQVHRTCLIKNIEVQRDSYCENHIAKGKVVSKDTVCNYPEETTYFN